MGVGLISPLTRNLAELEAAFMIFSLWKQHNVLERVARSEQISEFFPLSGWQNTHCCDFKIDSESKQIFFLPSTMCFKKLL